MSSIRTLPAILIALLAVPMGAAHAEPWAELDAPSRFDTNLDHAAARLPATGEASRIPWAGPSWPTYKDSINDRWNGASSSSAAAKYGNAFGVAGVEDAVSLSSGINSRAGLAPQCTSDAQCDVANTGAVCAKRPGQAQGYCTPTAFGLGHALTAASILLPEPRNPVTANGIAFKVNDVKALVTLSNVLPSAKFVSGRCEQPATTLTVDAGDRPVDPACRDTNPGSLHVLLANYLGIRHESFAEDRRLDASVWNQPLRGYRITAQTPLTAQQANAELGVALVGEKTDTRSGRILAGTWSHQAAIPVPPGSQVKVTMKGSGDADLYVRFDGQPTASAYDCRPYASTSDESCSLSVPPGATNVQVSVQGYAVLSSFTLTIATGGTVPAVYAFNDTATFFYRVKAEVDTIGDSSPSADGNLASVIDRYTQTSTYDYVLEVNADGNIVGGEWLGSSRRSHPDFLWLPTGHFGTEVAGGKINDAQVRQLLQAALESPGPGSGSSPDHTVIDEAGTVGKGSWKSYGPYNLAAGATLSAVLTGSGDADLYVRKGGAPSPGAYDCRPYLSGSNESCSVTGPGSVYVAVNGYATTSSYQLHIDFIDGGGAPPPASPGHLNQAGSISQGEMKPFQVSTVAGKKLVMRTTSPIDVDLYLRADAAPTTSQYLQRGYTSSGNEILGFTPTATGTLYIGVYGNQAGTFTLTTSDF